MRKLVWFLFVLFLVAGCARKPIVYTVGDGPDAQGIDAELTQRSELPIWMQAELKDIATGETFKLSDFQGRKILVESFAVWCPVCLKQQQELAQLQDENVVRISLDTDPNEDEGLVMRHVEDYGLQWRFAVAPEEMTKALITEFGVGVVNAPAAPLVLICEDFTFRMLGRGLKPVSEVQEELEKGC